MPIAIKVLGVLCALVGCIWVLQGINVLPGSFMTGQTKWAAYGAAMVVIGIVLFVWAGRRTPG